MKFFRYILISFFFLILCEIALQLLALKTNPYGSYAQFFEQALKKISTQEAKNTVFFVGDSTIYGGGASYEALYSLPAQFSTLLKAAGSPFEVVNLGYPGTMGKQHLELLRNLPPGAHVFLRSGINYSWNRFESYKIHLFGNYYEIRLLKLFLIAVFGWSRNESTDLATHDYFQELIRLSEQKKFSIFYLDYFLGEVTFMNDFFSGREDFIPMAEILKNSGFFNGERISTKYLSFDLLHANDMGYKLQSLVLFNELARRNKLALEERDQLPLVVDQKDVTALISKFEEDLKQLPSPKGDLKDLLRTLLKSSWQLHVITGRARFLKNYRRVERVYLFAYHDYFPAMYALDRERRRKLSGFQGVERGLSTEQINFYLKLVRLFGASEFDWEEEYKELFNKEVNLPGKYSDYSMLVTPFPVEFCPKILKETGWSKQEVSVLEDWKTLFGSVYSNPEAQLKNQRACNPVFDQRDS